MLIPPCLGDDLVGTIGSKACRALLQAVVARPLPAQRISAAHLIVLQLPCNSEWIWPFEQNPIIALPHSWSGIDLEGYCVLQFPWPVSLGCRTVFAWQKGANMTAQKNLRRITTTPVENTTSDEQGRPGYSGGWRSKLVGEGLWEPCGGSRNAFLFQNVNFPCDRPFVEVAMALLLYFLYKIDVKHRVYQYS